MQAAYNQDEELTLRIRLLPALAFASPFDVLEVFGDVVQQPSMPQATDLVLYFEKTYVGRKLLGDTYQNPLFLIDICNYHYDTAFGLQLMQLKHGTALSMLLLAVKCQHPNIWKFITALNL